MSKDANIYPFSLDFNKCYNGKPFFASFPFIINGEPAKGITCGISSVFAGDMKYESTNQNRQNLFAELGLNPVNVYGLKQIHSRSVMTVSAKNAPLAEADAMVTQDSDIILSVTTADCLPIYLLDAKSGAFGIAHSGWKGTGIAIDAVSQMKKNWGTKPCDVAAVLGPCIGSCCYNVDEERAFYFKNEFGSDSVREHDNKYYLDLKTANITLLKEAGVKNISVCEDCTFTDKRLGSFRREGEKFTRMAALAGIIPG